MLIHFVTINQNKISLLHIYFWKSSGSFATLCIIKESSKLYHEILGDMVSWLLEIVHACNVPPTVKVKGNTFFPECIYVHDSSNIHK